MLKKKALICGISGQDGAYLSKLLLDKGYDVWGTSRDVDKGLFYNLKTLKIFSKVKLQTVQIDNYDSILNAVKISDPDEIYYLAGQSSVGLSFKEPAETIQSMTLGVINFLNAIRYFNKKIKFYNAGSSECFGNLLDKPATEITRFNPRSPYGIAKVAAHNLVTNYSESYSLFACTGVLFNHESIFRPERYVTQKIIQSAKMIFEGRQEKLELGRLDISRDWGWAQEYVEAMWLMLQQEEPEDYLISTGKTFTLQEFVDESFSTFDLDWKEFVVVSEKFKRPTDILISSSNPIKAKNKLSWQAKYSMKEVVKKMINGDIE
jgi:GDPmannose 4,6-dehydratase